MFTAIKSRMRATALNSQARFGLALVASIVVGIFVPQSGCGGTESWCSEVGGCFNRDKGECGALPACSWALSCRGSVPDCPVIASQSNCENTAGCIWDTRGSGCVMDTTLIECESITDGAACSTHSYCSWSIGCTANRSIDCDSAKSQAACEGLGRC